MLIFYDKYYIGKLFSPIFFIDEAVIRMNDRLSNFIKDINKFDVKFDSSNRCNEDKINTLVKMNIESCNGRNILPWILKIKSEQDEEFSTLLKFVELAYGSVEIPRTNHI